MNLKNRLGLSLASIVTATILACGPKPEIREKPPQERGLISLRELDSFNRRCRPEEIKPFNVQRGFGVVLESSMIDNWKYDNIQGTKEILFFPNATDSVYYYFDSDNSGSVTDFMGDYILYSSSKSSKGGKIYHVNGISDFNTGLHRHFFDLTDDQEEERFWILEREDEFFRYLVAQAKAQ